MAGNDGIDRTAIRNQDLSAPGDAAEIQEHNEREENDYSNQDVVSERTSLNIHFKAPMDDYMKMLGQMEQDGMTFTRGLKPDAVKYSELVSDMNSAYFHNHGDYELVRQFYANAYKAAVKTISDGRYILSAVMHADKRNRAMLEALGKEVHHYHLHVVYIPVVEKQIFWSKRCKGESLRRMTKETITQVSCNKKRESEPVLDEGGNPKPNEKGKKTLRSFYSVLQDDFSHLMQAAGYTNMGCGKRGSTEEHLTVTQFKAQAEQQWLKAVTGQVAQVEQGLEDARAAAARQKKKLGALQKETEVVKIIASTMQSVEAMGKEAIFGNSIVLTPDGCDTLRHYVVSGIIANADNEWLKEELASAEKTVSIWRRRYEAINEKRAELKQRAQPFPNVLEITPKKARVFINSILIRGKGTQEYEHPARKRGRGMEL